MPYISSASPDSLSGHNSPGNHIAQRTSSMIHSYPYSFGHVRLGQTFWSAALQWLLMMPGAARLQCL